MFFQFPARGIDPLHVVANVNCIDLPIEVNTDVAVSLMSGHIYRTTWLACHRPHLQLSSTRLCTYSGQLIKVLGSISVTATYQNQSQTLPLFDVPTEGPSLLGCDWLKVLYLDWKQLYYLRVGCHQALQHVLDEHASLFIDEMDNHLEQGGSYSYSGKCPCSVFHSRPVTYTLWNKAEAELQRLQHVGIITPLQFS